MKPSKTQGRIGSVIAYSAIIAAASVAGALLALALKIGVDVFLWAWGVV